MKTPFSLKRTLVPGLGLHCFLLQWRGWCEDAWWHSPQWVSVAFWNCLHWEVAPKAPFLVLLCDPRQLPSFTVHSPLLASSQWFFGESSWCSSWFPESSTAHPADSLPTSWWFPVHSPQPADMLLEGKITGCLSWSMAPCPPFSGHYCSRGRCLTCQPQLLISTHLLQSRDCRSALTQHNSANMC